MKNGELLDDLLLRWEELTRAGRPVSAEDLCPDQPGLAEELKRRMAALQKMAWLSRVTGGPGLAAPTGRDQLPVAGGEPVPGYRLVRPIGRGGFGEVWEATAPDGSAVALKFVPWADRGAAVEERGLEAVQGLRHPHLLPVLGSWQTDGFLILAMELADRTLLDRLQEVKGQGLPGIPGEELLPYFRQAAAAVDFLQERGVQHRDLKPQNLLLQGGALKVADFGLARVLCHSMTSHTGCLSIAYAAPEFFEGNTTRHSDQYCLAVAYCQLRGGRLPFEGTPAEVMAGHLQRPPDLSLLPGLERPAVARALAKNPSARWPSCQAFVEAIPTGEGFSKTPLPAKGSDAPKGRRLLSRTRLAVTGLALVVLAAAWFAGLGKWLLGTGGDTPPSAPSTPPARQLVKGSPAAARKAPAAWPGPVQTFKMPKDALNVRRVAVGWVGGKWNRLVALTNGSRGPIAWDVEKREVLRRLKGKPGPAAALAPFDKPLCVTGDDDGKVQVWNLETGDEVKSFQANKSSINWVCFSPDGTEILTASCDKTVRLWDSKSGKELQCCKGHQRIVTCAVFDPTGQEAVSGSLDGTVRHWDLTTGHELQRFESHSAKVQSVCVSPDGKLVLTTGDDGFMRLSDLKAGGLIRKFPVHTDHVNQAVFWGNSKLVVSVAGKNVSMWDLDRGRELLRSPNQPTEVQTVAPIFGGKHPRALFGTAGNGLRLLHLPQGFPARGRMGKGRPGKG